MTNDLRRRLWEHRNSRGPAFAARYNCHRLVYFEWSQDIRDAIVREKQIKSWSRAKKDALIATINPEWKDLSAGWSGLTA